jgi:hypothetical protein
MTAERFLTWLYYTTGLDAHAAQRKLTIEQRNALVTNWLAMGCPFAVGV